MNFDGKRSITVNLSVEDGSCQVGGLPPGFPMDQVFAAPAVRITSLFEIHLNLEPIRIFEIDGVVPVWVPNRVHRSPHSLSIGASVAFASPACRS